MTTPTKVDIWSDVQCPWCYIGKRKFEQGVAESGVPVEVEYHSFELAPDTPVDFEVTPVDYLSAKYRTSREQAMVDRVVGIAAEVGLDRDAAFAVLADHGFLPDVKADVAQASAYGITGVPFYVIDGRYGVSGAQAAAAFAQVLTQVAAERAA